LPICLAVKSYFIKMYLNAYLDRGLEFADAMRAAEHEASVENDKFKRQLEMQRLEGERQLEMQRLQGEQQLAMKQLELQAKEMDLKLLAAGVRQLELNNQKPNLRDNSSRKGSPFTRDSVGSSGSLHSTPSKMSLGVTNTTKLQTAVDRLTSVTVSVNGVRFPNSGNIVDALKKDTDITPFSSPYVNEVEAAELYRLMDLQTALRQAKEQPGQALVSSFADRLKAVDTSKDASYSLFHMPRQTRHTDAVYPLSAKVDIISNLCCMLLELKNSGVTDSDSLTDVDADALQQAVDRVFVFRATSAWLKDVVVITVTGRAAWLLEFSRDVRKYGKAEFEVLHISRITHCDVWRVWTAYSAKSVENSHWFLTPDAKHLVSTLSCITNPVSCISQLIASSRHRVYGISFLAMLEQSSLGDRKAQVIGASLRKYDICIKIFEDDTDFANESRAAMAVREKYLQEFPDKLYYVLNTHKVSDGRILATTAAETEEPSADTDHVVWAASYVSAISAPSQLVPLNRREKLGGSKLGWMRTEGYGYTEVKGGTLVMRPGQQVTLSSQIVNEWNACVIRDLRIMHKAGFVHCDVRPANTLLFGDTYHLVDFDLALPKDAATFTFVQGGQYDHRPSRWQGARVGEEVEWSTYDDLGMVISVIINYLIQQH
jgi:hypothetical protein